VREALAARSPRDFARVAPAPRRDRTPTSALTGALSRAGRAVRRRPAAVAGALAVTGAAVAVALNALAFQSGRHPAPLFAPKPAPASAPASAAPAPLPPARPAAAPASAPTSAPKPTASGRDPIGDKLRAAEGVTNSLAARAPAADPHRPVAAAQRALAKLGYGPLKADGVLGEGTRQAIERFERDRRLAVTRDLAPRTLKELSAQSGVAIE
jgi:Putative peptidoglycan binding domain